MLAVNTSSVCNKLMNIKQMMLINSETILKGINFLATKYRIIEWIQNYAKLNIFIFKGDHKNVSNKQKVRVSHTFL